MNRLLLAQLVGARASRGGAGGEAGPAILAGGGKGVGAEADAAGLEEVHDADQLAELGQGHLGTLGALFLLDDGEELGLPGGAAHALAAHRLDWCLDRVGADDLNSVGELQARQRHPQPDQGRNQHLGLLGAAGLGLEHGERVAQAIVVEGKFGAAVPERGEEDGEHLCRPLAGVTGDLLAASLQISGGDAGGSDGVAGRREGVQLAQLAFALTYIEGSQRPVAIEERVVAALGIDVIRDLVATGDKGAELYRRLGGKAGQRLVEQAIAHGPRFPPVPGAPAPARCLAGSN